MPTIQAPSINSKKEKSRVKRKSVLLEIMLLLMKELWKPQSFAVQEQTSSAPVDLFLWGLSHLEGVLLKTITNW
jgi:hypothetical protein